MVHIAPQRDRQYFAHELEGHEVSQGIQAIGQGLQNSINTGISVVQKANESKLANNQIDLSTRFLQKNNEINTKWQADPTNPEVEKERQEAFEALASEYKINPLCDTQWNEIKNNVYNRYKQYNAQWAEKQQYSNIQLNLQNGYESLVDNISMLGLNGAGIDEIRLVYANGIEGLRNGAVAGLGEVTVNEFLKDSNHDIMTTYVSALALNNPLEAQKLLKDKGVRDDIGDAGTIEKLENYVNSSLTNQNKRVAVEQLGNTLRSMNSDEAKKILNGQADLNRVMKFIETNKNLPEGSKDLVLGIYGIGSKTDYYYDRDKKKIIKKPEGGSRGRAGSGSGSSTLTNLKKLSKEQKNDLVIDLEDNLIQTFTFSDNGNGTVNAKKVSKNKTGHIVEGGIVGRLQQVANMQGQIDTFRNAGLISASKRQQLMDKYITPMTDFLEQNMNQLDEKQGWFGKNMLGYGRLKKEFSTEGIPKNHTTKIRAQKQDLLTAQGLYYDQLDKARRRLNLNSIYDLENLPKHDQEVIYKQASDYAIDQTKRYGSTPERFFKQEYPALYKAGCDMFGVKDGEALAHQVAKKIYSAEKGEKVDVTKEMSDAMLNLKTVKQQKAKDTVKAIMSVYTTVTSEVPEGVTDLQGREGRPMTEYDLERRAKNLGLTVSQLTNDAYSKRVRPEQYLIYLEYLKRNKK